MASLKRPGHYLIGLTGNIATGKSSVMALLRQRGAKTIDADRVAHQVLATAPVREAIVRAFGEGVLRPDGGINRAALGQIVFRDPPALQRLEAIVHPAVKQVIDAVVEQAEESVIVVEAIKLIEAGMHRDCDALWVVTATPEQQAARLTTERGLSKEEAWLRIRAQSPQSEKVAQANVVIENSGSRKALEQQVDTEWRKVQAILHRSGA